MALRVGDLVIPRLKRGLKKLLLWSDSVDPGEVATEIDRKEILTILKIENFENKSIEALQPEWNKRAYMLLSSTGAVGWTGGGWIKKLPPSSQP
jgi:hypothetical protein